MMKNDDMYFVRIKNTYIIVIWCLLDLLINYLQFDTKTSISDK